MNNKERNIQKKRDEHLKCILSNATGNCSEYSTFGHLSKYYYDAVGIRADLSYVSDRDVILAQGHLLNALVEDMAILYEKLICPDKFKKYGVNNIGDLIEAMIDESIQRSGKRAAEEKAKKEERKKKKESKPE